VKKPKGRNSRGRRLRRGCELRERNFDLKHHKREGSEESEKHRCVIDRKWGEGRGFTSLLGGKGSLIKTSEEQKIRMPNAYPNGTGEHRGVVKKKKYLYGSRSILGHEEEGKGDGENRR